MRKLWHKQIDEITASGIVFRYVEGTPALTLAFENGVRPGAIKKLLISRGCVIRTVERPEDDVEIAREMRREGHTYKEIGNELGITRQAAHQLLRRRNAKNQTPQSTKKKGKRNADRKQS